jgi:hypothetical protein
MTVQEQQFELIIEGVLANGYAVCDDFLDKTEVQNLLKTFDTRYQAGKFKEAGIGKQSEVQQATQIRGDQILIKPLSIISIKPVIWESRIPKFILLNTILVNSTAATVILFKLKKEEFYPSSIT